MGGVIFTNEEARRTQRVVEHFEKHSHGVLPPILKKVRLDDSEGTTVTDPDDSDGGGNCGCSFLDVGTEDCLGGTNNAPAKMVIDNLGIFGVGVDVIFDSDCTYISDEISHTC